MIVEDYLRRSFARLDLRAHLLQAGSKRFNLLLLLRDSRFLFGSGRFYLGDPRVLLLHFAMFLEELVEQHRVHRLVADSQNLAIFIAPY